MLGQCFKGKEQAQQVADIFAEESKMLPAFEELPLHIGDPKYSAWGLWGLDDEAGTLVSLVSYRTMRAAY